MALTKPYKTTNDLVETIQRRITFPLSQSTYTYNDIVRTLNEELMISAVPSVKSAHEEFFVYKVSVPLVTGINRYVIPSRSIGQALRDVLYADNVGNLQKLSRVAPDDKAFFQRNGAGPIQRLDTYYLEGNEVVITNDLRSGVTGSLVFYIYLRPNFLVRDDRACFIENFVKTCTISDNSAIVAGNTITITTGNQTPYPSVYTLTAVSSSPGADEFLIGATANDTAANLNTLINSLGDNTLSSTVSLGVVTISYDDISTTFEIQNETAFTVDQTYTYIKFDQLPSSYTDPETDVTETFFQDNSLVDFLQTNPGHRTYTYDVKLYDILSGNIGKFKTTELQTYLSNSNFGELQMFPIKIGDYMALANECIIPQIPPELHVALAQQTAATMLMSIGDTAGMQAAQGKLAEMAQNQSKMIDSRVEGSVPKVFNPYSHLRLGKRGSRRRF